MSFVVAWTIWSLSIVGFFLIPFVPIRTRRGVNVLRGNSSGNAVATSYSQSKSKLIPIIPGRTRP